MMVLLVVLLYKQLHDDTLEKRILFVTTYFIIGLSFIIQLIMKDPFFMLAELQFYMKAAYFVTLLYTVLFLRVDTWLTQRDIAEIIHIITLIIGITYWTAILTNSSLASYAYHNAGYAGWVFSANELSVIMIVLIALTLAINDKRQTVASFIIFLLTLSVAPFIGTKTASYGAIIVLLGYISLLIWYKQFRRTVPIVSLLIIFGLIIPYTPFGHNMFPADETANNERQTIETEHLAASLLSSRDHYLQETKIQFNESNFLQRLIGLGYGGHYETAPKLIEMDFHDLFFSFGYIGTVVLLIPLILVTIQLIQWRQPSVQYKLLFGVYVLFLSISYVAGHVLFAPAVMNYIALLIIYIAQFRGGRQANG